MRKIYTHSIKKFKITTWFTHFNLAKELQYPHSIKKKVFKEENVSPASKEKSPLIQKYFDNKNEDDTCSGVADKAEKPVSN